MTDIRANSFVVCAQRGDGIGNGTSNGRANLGAVVSGSLTNVHSSPTDSDPMCALHSDDQRTVSL